MSDEQIERRQKDRRKGDRRGARGYICDKCSGELIYVLPERLMSNECYECKGCGQKYVVLKFRGRRSQLVMVENI
jgi:DNA-directed RNA polymerase subunit RPC12/RpoP